MQLRLRTYAKRMMESAVKPARIYLLRHANAGWAAPGERDFDRRLDLRGRSEADGIGAIMAVNGFLPALVLCSDAARCVETLRALEVHLNQPREVQYCTELYVGGHDSYIDLIARADGTESILVIGHNPMMEDTAHALVCRRDAVSSEALAAGFPTGGLAIIDLPGPLRNAREGTGELRELLGPHDG